MLKVQYFQDGRGRKFSYQNTEFHIPKATRQHGGSYFCRGIIGTLNVSSEAVNITVLGEPGAGLRGPEPPTRGVGPQAVLGGGGTTALCGALGGAAHSAAWQQEQTPPLLTRPTHTTPTAPCVPANASPPLSVA